MKALYHLFAGKPFDFYTEYTLRETYQRLVKKTQHKSIGSRLLQNWRHLGRIELEPVKSDKFRFRFTRDAGQRMWIIAHGIVEKDSYGVHVAGKVEVGCVTLFFVIIQMVMTLGLGAIKLFIPSVGQHIVPVPFGIILLINGLSLLVVLYTQLSLYLNIRNEIYVPISRE